MAHVLIANQRSLTVRTPHKPLQNVLAVLQMSKLTELFVILALFLLGDLLNLFKGLAVNDWFVGITDDNPVGFVHIGLSLSLVKGLLLSPLNHVTYVNGV